MKRILEAITALIVHIGVSREINEDGSWDNYNERKNRRRQRKARYGK
jgi:hypothetical protein